MKRNLLPKSLQRGLLAVPAAAMMLGAAQAGTTIGLNFQSWYYDSGATPQTVGYGAGYQTTGFPVTAKAFGVATANWFNTDPLDCNGAVSVAIPFNSLSLQVDTENMWESNIGPLIPGFVPGVTVAPGNDEVTWSFEDNTGWTNTLSGLNAVFPNGYVMQLIGAGKCTTSSRVVFTAGAAAFTNAFDTIYTAGNTNGEGPVGLLATPVLNEDSVTFGAVSRSISTAQSCALAGFIVTDKPVVAKDPPNVSINQGAALNLSAGSVIGIGPLAYQWRLGGTPITDATNATYTVPDATGLTAGNYDLVVTNAYGVTTSGVATVTVVAVPNITLNLSGASNSIYAGASFSQWKVVAAGAEPLHYNWLKNGTTPVGSDSATLTLTNLTPAESGDYSVTVTNLLGTAKSSTNHLTVVASPDLYTTDVAQDSPGAYWPLNETTGTSAYDYSGLGNTGLDTNLTLGVNGPRPPAYQGFYAGKTAYQFDGASAYIDCGTGPSLSGTTDFTLEAWINTTATASGQILQQRSQTGFNGEYFLGVNAAGNVTFSVYGGGYQFNALTAPNIVNDGNWHYIAAVRRNGTNGAIYIDGKIAATQNVTPVAPLDATIATYIGADTRDSVSYFNGSISDVAIYPFALSDNRIIRHAYNGQYGNTPFAISIIPGGYVADSKPAGTPHSGLNNNATWVASSTDGAGTPVTRTGVEQFSAATGSQIVVPANPDFGSAAGSFTFWMRATAPIPGPGTQAAILFDRRTTNGIVIALDDAGAIFVQSSPAAANTFSTGYLPDDLWHFVTVTYDQSVAGAITVYIDAALSLSSPNATNWSWPAAQQLELGRSHDSYWKRYNGLMDDFRLYNRVLTAPEIAAIYASGALVDSSALMLRFDFTTAGIGESLSWPIGLLESSPTLGPSALWTPVPGATPPYPFLSPQDPPTIPGLFYRAGF